MANARIVFADGSKQMAHNNDDLYQRWMMKREEVPAHSRKPETYVEVFLPDIVLPSTVDDARNLQHDLLQKKHVLQQNLSQLGVQNNAERWKPHVLKEKRAPAAAAMARVDAQLTQVKGLLLNLRQAEGLDMPFRELREKYEAALERIIELQDEIIRLKSNGI